MCVCVCVWKEIRMDAHSSCAHAHLARILTHSIHPYVCPSLPPSLSVYLCVFLRRQCVCVHFCVCVCVRVCLFFSLSPSAGDGANDVPMIQEAHVGVGIAGMEGMQVRSRCLCVCVCVCV